MEIVGFAFSVLGVFWSICWGVFVFLRERTQKHGDLNPPPSIQKSSIIAPSFDDVKKYDPKTRAIVAAAEREGEPRGLPVGMGSGADANTIRFLAALAAVTGLVYFLIARLTADSRGFVPRAALLVFVLSFFLFVIASLYDAFMGIIVGVILGVVLWIERLTDLWKQRKRAACIVTSLLFPYYCLITVAIFVYVSLAALAWCFLFQDDETIQGIVKPRLDRLEQLTFKLLKWEPLSRSSR